MAVMVVFGEGQVSAGGGKSPAFIFLAYWLGLVVGVSVWEWH